METKQQKKRVRRDRYIMTGRKQKLFFNNRCPDCEGWLEDDWSAARMVGEHEHSIVVYNCRECGQHFAKYNSTDPYVKDYVDYYWS